MSFREKMAWLTLSSMVVAYGIYFGIVANRAEAGAPTMPEMLVLFAGVTIVQAVVVGIVAAALALHARREADAAADERDRNVARRGASVAYYVLLVGMILVGVVMPFGAPAWQIVNAALMALVTAEAVRLALVIRGYRSGWHG